MNITGSDTTHYQLLRKQLVAEVAGKGITDQRVLNALAKIPRHFFIDEEYQELAYQDRPIPIGEGQTISQPFTVAYQTQLLQVSPADKILEIGTGSAYQACVLAAIGRSVFTIERQKKLFTKYRQSPFLRQFDNLHFFYGDGHEGLPEAAPFDRILITAASTIIPSSLLDQLNSPGILIVPFGSTDESQVMTRLTKSVDGSIKTDSFGKFKFVPMIKGING
jgi:protein-L-isoaspartate(D-aspartate) O-methyltransferase